MATGEKESPAKAVLTFSLSVFALKFCAVKVATYLLAIKNLESFCRSWYSPKI